MKAALLAAPLMTALIGSGVQQSAFANTFDPQQHYQIQQRLEERKTAQCREAWKKAQYEKYNDLRHLIDENTKKVYEISSYRQDSCSQRLIGVLNNVNAGSVIIEKITIEGKEIVKYKTVVSTTFRYVLGVERSAESFSEDVR